jgi:acyl-coenzyme A thioesterase PaaI-like protein
MPKTISITVEYLRSAKATTTWARTEIIHHGRRVATVRGVAYQDDVAKPVARRHRAPAGQVPGLTRG